MADIELRVLGRQCPSRRIPDAEMLAHDMADWLARITAVLRGDWQFTKPTRR